MSRRISTHTTAVTAQQSAKVSGGKLLLTSLKERETAILIKNNRLVELSFPGSDTDRIGQVYLGKVKKIQSNINACFVEITNKELVYLSLDKCFDAILTNRTFDGRILEGDELILQLEKEAYGSKLAAATARITLKGRLVVFHTGSKKAGISSKLSTKEREVLAQSLIQHGYLSEDFHWLRQPAIGSVSAVIRTEAASVSEELFLQEVEELQTKLLQMLQKASCSTCFVCLSAPASRWENCISQFRAQEYEEVVTDIPALYQEYREYFLQKHILFRLYEDVDFPLSRLYSLESRLEDALSRRIWLKSGAYLIVDTTEALTVFDVNSGKYEARATSAEAFFNINAEAAWEIAHQIRLRNLSGIILIDFINMDTKEHKKELITIMKDAVSSDPVPVEVVDITPLGLMELTRRKINRPLSEQLKNVTKKNQEP